MSIIKIYNDVAADYDNVYQQSKYVLDELETAKHLAKLKPYGGVLSLGCGTGQDIDIGGFNSLDFLGLDISKGMLEVAKAKFPDYKFLEWDCSKTYSYSCDTVIGMYGVVNYTSLQAFLDQVIESNATKFFAVLFSPKYVPDLAGSFTTHYSKEEINEIMSEYNLRYSLSGLFDTIPFEENNYWVLSSL